MDEFIKVNPDEKKLNELYRSLEAMERMEVIKGLDGKIDTCLVTRTKKYRLSGSVLTPIK